MADAERLASQAAAFFVPLLDSPEHQVAAVVSYAPLALAMGDSAPVDPLPPLERARAVLPRDFRLMMTESQLHLARGQTWRALIAAKRARNACYSIPARQSIDQYIADLEAKVSAKPPSPAADGAAP